MIVLILLKRMALLLLSGISIMTVFKCIWGYNFKDENVKLPYFIEGSEIVLEFIGADNESGCAEAIFCNNGSNMIGSFYVELSTTSGLYCFETTMLPAGQKIILEERDSKTWKGSVLLYGSCSYSPCDVDFQQSLFEEMFTVENNILLIQNLEDTSILTLDIYLKQWDDAAQLFLDQKTERILIRDLYSGDSLIIELPGTGYKVVNYLIDRETISCSS